MAVAFEVKVKGLSELEKKLDSKFLLQPEVELRLRDKLVERIRRPRRKAGFQRNPLGVATAPLAGDGSVLATIGTPLNHPRRSGGAWLRFVMGLMRGSFMSRQLATAVKEINARWSS